MWRTSGVAYIMCRKCVHIWQSSPEGGVVACNQPCWSFGRLCLCLESDLSLSLWLSVGWAVGVGWGYLTPSWLVGRHWSPEQDPKNLQYLTFTANPTWHASSAFCWFSATLCTVHYMVWGFTTPSQLVERQESVSKTCLPIHSSTHCLSLIQCHLCVLSTACLVRTTREPLVSATAVHLPR